MPCWGDNLNPKPFVNVLVRIDGGGALGKTNGSKKSVRPQLSDVWILIRCSRGTYFGDESHVSLPLKHSDDGRYRSVSLESARGFVFNVPKGSIRVFRVSK